MKNLPRWRTIVLFGAIVSLLCSCQTSQNQPVPKLVNDFVLQNVPGSRDFAFRQDQLVEGERTKPVWAQIDPNNTFVTRVVVEWGDALPGQAEANLILQDEAQPQNAAARFTGDRAAYSTQPAAWAVRLPLRGNGPDITTPGNFATYTGVPAIDGLINQVMNSSPTPPRTTPAAGLPNGSFIQYTLHVFYKRSPAPDAPELGVYLPIRTHRYGPNLTATPPPFRAMNGNFEPRQVATTRPTVAGQIGETFEVSLRLERPVTRPTEFRFYSDPEGSLEVLDANNNPVTRTTFLPGSTSQDPFLQRWKVRVKGPAGAVNQSIPNRPLDPQLRQLWVHASGHAAGVLQVTGQ